MFFIDIAVQSRREDRLANLDVSQGTGNTKPEQPVSMGPGKLRFLVAIEFSSREAAVDHMVDLMTTGWPRGPKQENLKLIVINRQSDQDGRIQGVEVGTDRLNQLNQMIAKLG